MNQTNRPTSTAAEGILGLYFPVLDHGFVALVDYMGTDESIEQAARVSYGLGTRATSLTRGLVRYLRRHKHTTPSEMVEFKFHCSMPIFVARQWIRHRTASVNEYSGRYSIVPAIFYTPDASQVETQSLHNNQGRSGATVSADLYQRMRHGWLQTREAVVQSYDWMTANDVARELARIDLPLSTYTQWYWKIDLHNLLHFLSLRTAEHTQWEMREFARVIAGVVKAVVPISFEAWIDYELCGIQLSRMEADVMRLFVEADVDGLRGVDGTVDKAALSKLGLSDREFAELRDKLVKGRAVPDFSLNMSEAKTAEYFAAKIRAQVAERTVK